MAAAVEFPSVKYCLLFALLLSLCLKGGASRSLSREQVDEDLEIERQVNTLNKPPIKTIHTEWGDILDCVDINRQPAFDHPLLKDHKIRMKPSFSLDDDEKLSSTKRDELSSIFMLPDEECPEGTVPILRTHKESSIKPQTRSDGHSLAGVRYEVAAETFYGAFAQVDVYNPKLTNNTNDQSSSAEIAVENGPEAIRVGWTVNPDIYGDNNTHMFTLWKNDSYVCHSNDVHCSGFVQVDSTVYPGAQIMTTSVIGGLQIIIDFKLYQDDLKGDWWLALVLQNDENVSVGYWPKSLFKNLSEGCNRIYWGGNVKGSESRISPQMGSGRSPLVHNFGIACYMKQLMYVDVTRTLQNPKDYCVSEVLECSGLCTRRFSVESLGFREEEGLGQTFLFGGPGGPDDKE